MAKFFVGQRVRVVYMGLYYGRETVVLGVDELGYHRGRHFFDGIRVDLPHPYPKVGTCVYQEDDLIPILDRHEPCESDFKESLDKLLSEVSRETV